MVRLGKLVWAVALPLRVPLLRTAPDSSTKLLSISALARTVKS